MTGTIDPPRPPRARRSPTGRATQVLAGLGIAVAAVPFVTEAVFVLRASSAQLHASAPDDAYYYLEIARRAAGGEGFTFDGINSTSGFHPLWQWILTVLHLAVPGDSAFIRATHLLALVLVAGAFALTARVVWRAAGPLPAIGGLLLASHSATTLWDLTDGMETAVVVATLALLLAALDRYLRRPDPRGAALVGLACAGLVLARLDMAVMVPLVGVVVVVAGRPRRRIAGSWAAGGLALGVPWLLWHLWNNDGRLLTTSAAVKQRWTDELVTGQLGGWFSGRHLRELAGIVGELVEMIRRQVTDSALGTDVGLLVAMGLLALATVGALDSAHRHRLAGTDIGPTGRAGLVVCGGLALKFAVDLVVTPIWVLQWYSTPGRTAAAWVLGVAAATGIGALARRSNLWLVPLVPLVVVAVVPHGLGQVSGGNYGYVWQSEMDRALDWVLVEGPDGTYGSFDAGLAGYRLDGIHPLVNLDGLTNDNDYVDFLADHPGRLQPARREGVDILVGPLPLRDRQGDLACSTTLWEGYPGARADGTDPTANRVWVLDLRTCP